MRAWVALVFGVAAIGCGGSSAPPPATELVLADAPAAGSDDLVVARVDGHPVWGSCVAAQATRTGGDRRRALDDCIAFELLAWRANAAGYANDPDVVLARKNALVGRVLDVFAHAKPAELEPTYDKAFARASGVFRHAEARASAYARIVIPANAPPELDAKAHAVADQIAAKVRDLPGLSLAELADRAKPLADAAGVKLDTAPVTAFLPQGLDPSYAKALFAIPEAGRIAPAAVRTPWGWDVILATDILPPTNPSDDEINAKILTDVRRLDFANWVANVARADAIHTELAPDAEQLLGDMP